jgi:predicted ABC-type ATPase
MEAERPRLVVLAGPNGAGKSTVAPILLQGALGVDEFVNADVIAQGLSAFRPEDVSFEAGRLMLQRLRELAGSE